MRRETRLGLTLSVLATVLTLLTVEVGLRVRDQVLLGHPAHSLENSIDRTFRLMADACATIWDPDLGWTASPSKSLRANRFDTQVTILENGLRSNGKTPDSHLPKILTAGDSLTFGDNVSDHESWPAYLEGMLPYQVLNAGVCAYGMDQAYLRARKMIEAHRPKILIYSTAISGINRSAWSAYEGITAAPKPYYEIRNGSLVLRNQPVPHVTGGITVEWPHRIFGYSALASKVMNRVAGDYWKMPFRREPVVESGQDGDAVACKLMERLKEDAIREKRRTIVLIQYWWRTPPEHHARLERLMKCVDTNVLELVDLRPTLEAIRARSEQEYDNLYVGHMSAQGNQLVAQVLKEAILKKGRNSLP